VASEVQPYAYAAQRDASWLDRPDVRSLKKWHVDRGNGKAACSNPDSWSSRCNPDIQQDTRVPLAEVPPTGRCQRPGCRKHWPTEEG
jgi:hypothetical protein